MNQSSMNVSCYKDELTNLKNEVNATALEYFFYSFIFCLFTIFPFYVYLNKVNRSRDESVSIFPVTNHLYKTVKVTYFMVFSIILLLCIGIYLVKIFILWLILMFASCLILFALHIITQVTQLFISLLAIRKFIIHFFPSSVQSVIKVQRWLLCNYWLLYVGFLLKEPLRVIFVTRYQDSCEKDFRFDKILYLAFNIFHISSALLYVAVSFRMKERNTESWKKNRPQRLIVWQTKIIMIFKLLAISLGFLFYYLDDDRILTILMSLYIFDVMITPLIVQISYLANNKKSLKTLLFNFKFANFIRVLMDIEVKSDVEPAGINVIAMDQKEGPRIDEQSGKSYAVGAVSLTLKKDAGDENLR